MNKKIHSLALLVDLGIYGVALPAMADDNTASARRNHGDHRRRAEFAGAGVSTITADAIHKTTARAGRGGNHPHHAGR
ncbi:hypothetical protein ACNKHO_03280 [Shigella flexneri]